MNTHNLIANSSSPYSFNGMEKDDEVKGEGNSYSSFFRQLDPRLGRWLSVDPVYKADQSPYISMSNNPIIMVDPKGDDDYYNKKGQFIGSDGSETNNLRLIDQTEWDKAWAALPEDDGDDNPFTSPTVDSKLLVSKSKIITFQSMVEQEKTMKSMETKTTTDNTEAAGYIVLDITTGKVSIMEDNGATRREHSVSRSSYQYKLDDPATHYIDNGKFNLVILGGIHTHPQDGGTPGPSTPENAYDPNYVDTETSSSCKCNEYVLDGNLFKATASGGTEEMDRSNVNVSQDALQTYGTEHPAPTYQK